MNSFFIFSVSFILLVLIFFRRYKMTERDFELQERLEKEEKRKQMNEEKIQKKTFEANSESARNENYGKHGNISIQISKLMKQAEYYLKENKLIAAQKIYIEITSLDNQHAEANKKLALLYLQQDDNKKAEFLFRKLLQDKEDPIFYSNLGLCLFNQKKFDQAAQAYEKSISLDKNRAARYVNLAHVYHEMGENNKALKNFESAHNLDQKNTEYLFIIADYYLDKQDKLKVRQILDKVLDLEPYNDEAKLRLQKLGL